MPIVTFSKRSLITNCSIEIRYSTTERFLQFRFHFSCLCRAMLCGNLFKFILASLISCAASQNVEPRIVGGTAVTAMDGFKHQVSIRAVEDERGRFGNGHRCGGSLIMLHAVITAAHCVHDGSRYLAASNFVVAMGGLYRWRSDNNTLYIPALKIVGHKKFKPKTFENDIAAIILQKAVPFGHPTAVPIAMPTSSWNPGQACSISGWGTTAYEQGTQPDQLRVANLSINSRGECNQPNRHNGNVLIGMFCAGPFTGPFIVDSCQGDSGGPLVCGGILVGITSNGVGCALPNFPGIYIDVYHYRKWIEENDSAKFSGSLATILIALVVLFCNKVYC